MTPQVFISHSSKDKEVADAVCHHLESADIPCWMAPRNIEFGSDWTEAIMRGITASRVFVLVFSENANVSGHVRREVAKAFSLGLQVIPFRIEDTLPQSSLSYFLETVHWLDAVTAPLEKHLNSLTERVKKLLANGDSGTDTPVAMRATAYPGLVVPSKRRGWIIGAGLAAAAAVVIAAAWLYIAGDRTTQQRSFSNGSLAEISAKSVAVLPFESISAGKDDGYFADGVQDEILNNLAKIAQLKVISRTSVMQYRADVKRDMRQIAYALGVANVLEGTVRRDGNRVRVSAQLVDARSDNAVWADSYDRDLTDIFTIQSEVAQTIAGKLSAALSPEEKQRIEAKPTKNLEAYDMYLKAKEKIVAAEIKDGDPQKPALEALSLLKQAVQLDPNFAIAHCATAHVQNFLYQRNPTAEGRALADAAINEALRLQPDLPEVHLAYANHLYRSHGDYERARAELAIAKRGLPNNAEVMSLEALMDRQQGKFDSALQNFNEAIKLDPRNPTPIAELAETLSYTRQFDAAERVWDQLINLFPDRPVLRARKEYHTSVLKTGIDTAYRSGVESLSASMPDDKLLRSVVINLALDKRDWDAAKQLVEKMRGEEDGGHFAYGSRPVPVACYSILLARLEGAQPEALSDFAETRQQLSRSVEASPANAALLSNLAVVDALLGRKEDAISGAKRAVELLPISKDAIVGPDILKNLAVVYAWSNEPDLAFQQLELLSKLPYGVFYSDLKLAPYFEPLRKDPRFESLLAQLAPHD